MSGCLPNKQLKLRIGRDIFSKMFAKARCPFRRVQYLEKSSMKKLLFIILITVYGGALAHETIDSYECDVEKHNLVLINNQILESNNSMIESLSVLMESLDNPFAVPKYLTVYLNETAIVFELWAEKIVSTSELIACLELSHVESHHEHD